MFVLSNMISAAAQLINMALSLYLWIIVARALLSWVNPDPYNQIVQFLYRVTEPLMQAVRNALPMRNIGVDISPLIIIFAIYFLQMFLVPTLQQFAVIIR
jgi:YggT family protein